MNQSEMPPVEIDSIVGTMETTGMTETTKPDRRFQFSLRKLLLWTLVVAFTLGILSPLELDGIGWLVVAGWFVTVLMLRWGFGSKVAATVSAVAAMLLSGWFCYMVWVTGGRQPFLGEFLELVVLSGVFCGYLGLVPFLLVEGTCQAIDWLDRIGQREGS